MTERHHFPSFDGTQLAYHETGPAGGRPLLLLHGLFSSANVNWIKFGTAEKLAQGGRRVLMLDVRAHGDSAAPTDAAAYPEGVLEDDVRAWVQHLAFDDYDLAGFSLGARTAAITVAEGTLAPARLALCGMGLRGIADHRNGTSIPGFIETIDSFGTHRPGTEAYMTQQFLKANKTDLVAARHLLHALADAPESSLRAVKTETLVLCGAEDGYLSDAEALAEALPAATMQRIPGDHLGCVTKPEFGDALADWFGGGA
ncbi:MAG: alpha/beta hydrolase [Pacificimonas sp.]|jgi:pimeloyl-ACP methyl ester carboxylesterase|nr:alpha/beta hydrolase [Pacificimonas sp.]